MAGDRILTVKIAGDSKGAVGAIGAVEGRTVGLGKKLLKIGGLFAGLSFGKNMITDMVDVGKAYTKSMNVLEVASKATSEEMEQVGEKAKDLGADLTLPGVSAADAASAMTEIVKSGYSVQEAMDAAQGSLQLAGAANIDAASAAGIMADAMSIFQLEGKKANDVADRLAQTTNSVSGSIVDTSDAFKNAGPVWANAGFSVDELTTAIGMLAQNGIRGAEAGTTLKTMLMRLQAPSAKAEGIMKELGISAYDANGNIKSLSDIVKNYTGATKNMTNEERDKTAAILFGNRAVKGANLVLGRGAKAAKKMDDAISSQAGAAETAAAKNEGFGGAIDALEGQMENLYLMAWDKVGPALEKITRKAARGLEAFTDFAEGGPGKLADSLNNLDGDKFAEDIGNMVEKALDKISSLSGKVAKKIGDMFGSVDWVSLGIELGKAAVPMLIGMALGILNFDLEGLLKGLAKNWQAVLIGILSIALAPAKWIASLAKLLSKIPFIGKFLAWLVTGINKVGGKLKSILGKFFKSFGRAFKDAMGWTGPGLIQSVIRLFHKIRDKVLEWGGRLGDKMASVAVKMGTKLGNWLAIHGPVQAINALRKIRSRIFGYLSTAANWLVGHGSKILGGLIQGIRNRITDLMTWVRGLKGRVTGVFAGASGWLWAAGSSIIGGLISGIYSKFAEVRSALSKLTGMLPDWKGPAKRDAEILTPAGESVIDGFGRGLESRFGAVKKTLGQFTRDMEKGARDTLTGTLSGATGADLTASRRPGGRGPSPLFAGGSNGQRPIEVKVIVQGNVIGERDFAKRVTPTVRNELKKIGDRNSGRIFG